MKPETIAVHSGEEPHYGAGHAGDVVVPIHLSSTFARLQINEPTGGYEYSRSGNPTRHALEKRLAILEGGAGALAFSSGLAAEANALFLLKKGDGILACNDLYGGTHRLFNSCFAQFGLKADYADLRDVGQVQKKVSGKQMVWIETPSNPLLRIYDIRAISQAVHGENPECIVVVDNTFASPFFQHPLELGADIVVHSTTKYIGGHSDLVGGALIAKNTENFERLRFYQNAIGAVPGPFDCFLALRGLKTLPLRMKAHEENARAIAAFLESDPRVLRVNYPGLESHPQHELAKKQMTGFSGMLSFELVGGFDAAKKLVESTKLFLLAESLGGVESLIEHPASMTHSSIPEKERKTSGLSDGLVRLSVGIEHPTDLIGDLRQALDATSEGKKR